MEIEDILKNMRQRQPMQMGPIPAKKIVIALIVLLVVITVMGSIYTVDTESLGVVQRFGKYNRQTKPGMHIKLPLGIEKVTVVPVTEIQKEEFGFRTLKAGVDSLYLGADDINSGRADKRDLYDLITSSGEQVSRGSRQLAQASLEVLQSEYVMLTGGLNIIDVEWIVQYKISDVEQYLFNIREPRYAIRDASQAVMRQLIGNGSVDEALAIGRIEYEISAKEALQAILKEYMTGIQIVTVKLQSANPPKRVRPAFNEVNKALQEKEQRVNEAMKGYNEEVPKARGEALKQIESAKGYAAERVNRSQGDVAKFASVLAEYNKAPEVTRQRMYLETMAIVLPRISEKWIIEQQGAEGGILMKLDLEKKN